MIDEILTLAADPVREAELRARVTERLRWLRASAGQGDAFRVKHAEDAVAADPAAFAFDGGYATLTAAGGSWAAGRFETPSLAELRQRAGQGGAGRLWVFDGGSPITDVGSLQATADDGSLFQVASQFNCLESPGPFLTRVAHYFSDPTQGPRASVSAFPATLLRHYSAPSPDGRFVQTAARQIDLLADVFEPGRSPVLSGYLIGGPGLVAALEAGFERIRLGVHDGVEVALGHDWDGAVATPAPRVAQVFTSTVAGGGYGAQTSLGEAFAPACRLTLRAAYLGTLLAAASLGMRRAVLTLIGGGVFGNPISEIWAAILWAFDAANAPLDVVVNGFNLSQKIALERIVP